VCLALKLYQTHLSPCIYTERKIWLFHDQQNEREHVFRLGEPEALTMRSGKLAMINSLASNCGFKEDLPFPNLATSHVYREPEYMGLTYDLPNSFKEDINPGDLDVLASFLEGVDWSDDIPVEVGEEDANPNMEDDDAENDTNALNLDVGPEIEELEEKLYLDMVALNYVKPIL
jgi:hypothetical protein